MHSFKNFIDVFTTAVPIIDIRCESADVELDKGRSDRVCVCVGGGGGGEGDNTTGPIQVNSRKVFVYYQVNLMYSKSQRS